MRLNLFLPLKFKSISHVAWKDQSEASLFILDYLKGMRAHTVPLEAISLLLDRNGHFIAP